MKLFEGNRFTTNDQTIGAIYIYRDCTIDIKIERCQIYVYGSKILFYSPLYGYEQKDQFEVHSMGRGRY